MKKSHLLFAALFLIGNVFAQKTKVEEGSENIGGGSNKALSVVIYGSNDNDIEKAWKSYIKDFNPDKVSTKDGVFADNAKIKAISDNAVDVYAKTDAKKDGEVLFIVAFDLGGAFLNSSQHASQIKDAKKMLYDFAIKMTKEGMDEQIKAQAKVLEKLDDKQKDLVKDQEDLKKEIENNKAKIKKAEDDITKNKSDQEAKLKEIESQKKVIEELKKKKDAVD